MQNYPACKDLNEKIKDIQELLCNWSLLHPSYYKIANEKCQFLMFFSSNRDLKSVTEK